MMKMVVGRLDSSTVFILYENRSKIFPNYGVNVIHL
jgi:hypothetical protein